MKKLNAVNFNSIKFIDSLAEITSHRDRERIERSLLNTLLEFETESNFRLYQVLTLEPSIELGLLAYASHNKIITAEEIKRQELPEYFQQAIFDVIKNGNIISIRQEKSSPEIQIIYPAFDANEQIFAILIQTTKQLDYEVKHLVHGFLRIYSNYLELIEISKRDKLTGLLNRETLESEIERILTHNNNPSSPTYTDTNKQIEDNVRHNKGVLKHWLCILDIDHFKLVNDKYGHIYGDEILILVARLLEKSVRDCDKIFRFGGEEFVVIVRAFDQEDALLAFERIRRVIESHHYAKIDTLTVSIGGKEITHQTDPRNVISDADNALYYAKHHGRNQVQIYETLATQGKVTKAKFHEDQLDFF